MNFTTFKTLPFWIITAALITALIISQLIQDGVFMDGMLYISVSKNLADGLGTFWNPHFSKTSMFSFHEQPPLYFGLLALFYKVLGTSMYVERLFCFICFILTALYIHKIWKKLYSFNEDLASFSWLPILFWTSIPVCFWAYTNHVEETVMALFATGSIYYIFCALFLSEKIIYNLILGGVFIFLSSLTKGIQGIFPIAAAGIYWIIMMKNSSFKKMILYSLILTGVPVIIYGFLLLTNHGVYESFKTYFNIRLIGTFNNTGATTQNHFDLLVRLLLELLPISFLSGLILLITKKHKHASESIEMQPKIMLWFILVGLSGSLPLMVTLEQRGFYLVTTLPFFAIAIAMWVAPRLSGLNNKINSKSKEFRVFRNFTILLFLVTFIFSYTRIGKTKRDKELLNDIYTLGKMIPRGEIVSIPTEMWNDWNFQTYMVRYNYISLEASEKRHYFIIRKDLPKTLIGNNYKLLPIKTEAIDVYVLNK